MRCPFSRLEFLTVGFFEVSHAAGSAILFTLALPELDTGRALLATNALCWFPGFLLLLTHISEKEGSAGKRLLKVAVTLLSLGGQTKPPPYSLL